MKKLVLFFSAIFVAVTISSCNNELEAVVESDSDVEVEAIPQLYTYSFKIDETKATLSGTGVSWVSGDKVGMYLEGYTGYADVNTETSPKTMKLYSPSLIPAGSYGYAYYPYDAGNDNKEMNLIHLPNIQSGASLSAMPLAGIPFLIESDIPAKDKPNGTVNFMNLGSTIDFRVFSDMYNGETIEYITFTATSKKTLEGVDTDLAVSGDGYLDLTKVVGNDESKLTLLFGLGTDYDFAKVNDGATVVADSKANATTPIYLVVAPGIYTGTITIGTDVATYTFNYSNKTLARNVVKQYNMNLNNADRVAGVVETVKDLPYSEPFSTGIGEFTTDGVQVASTNVWQFASGYGMKATASIGSEHTNYASVSWLTSPWIDLTSVSHAYAEFEHVHRYAGTATSEFTFWVLTDEGGADWEQATIPNYATGSNWTFVESHEISLDAYVGHKVKIAFKYTSSTDHAGTWEIKNVYVAEKVYTTEFTWDGNSLEVEVGKSKSNHVTVNSGATISYSSDDVDIATVAADGTVTGVAVGSTTINVHVDANGNYPAKDDSFDVTVTPAIAYNNFSWDLSTNNTTSASEASLNWAYRGVTMVVAKESSTTNANNYCPPTRTSTRFYANSTLTITPYSGCAIGYVEFAATTEGYATVLKNSSWSNADASADGTTVTVTPDDGTVAFSATIGGTCGFTTVTVYYTGELETPANYTVSFSQPIETGCSFTVSVDDVAIDSGDEVTSGKVVKLTPTAGTDYVFTAWTVTDAGSNTVSVTSNQFTMPSSNVTISATFTRQYTITCNSVSHGTISASAAKAIAGTEITLTATPDSGYQLDSWTVTDAGSNSVAVTNNKFTMPASNVTVSATFAAGKTTVYTLSPVKATGNTAYGTYYNVTISTVAWSAPGNQNFDGYWRIGGNSITNTDRVIYSMDPMPTGNVDEIVISTNGVSNTALTVNSITVTAHSSAALAASGTDASKVSFTTSDDFTFAKSTAKSLTFTKSGNTNTSGYYYRIVINVTKATTGNAGLDLTGIVFYSN